jgi:eukaryotic-like serine/threonine-protein kinase
VASVQDQSPVPQLWGEGPAPYSIPLGAFVLQAPVARGGMGEIWQGVHPRHGVPVAVKVMTAEQLRVDEYREAFQKEIRAVASLSHAGIVIVLDHGVVDEFAQEASANLLRVGSPYLVMELSTGGTLHNVHIRGWRQLEGTLLRLLDALAHAHARGVIHRDIKPGNVLLPGPKDPRQSIKLTDFGTSHASDQGARAGLQEQLFGTLQYMPPEQIEGRWRDYGPWTDLYALGCMAWKLASGKLPFDYTEPRDLLRAHLHKEAPPLAPCVPVPEGFEDWLRRLISKREGERFQRAAEAAWALQRLGRPVKPSGWDETTDGPIDLGAGLEPVTRVPWAPQTLTAQREALGGGGSHPGAGPARLKPDDGPPSLAPSDAPPIPPSWRRPYSRPPTMKLVGAGLGLYGTRTIPVVDREGERNRVWDLLNEVHKDGSARLLLLDGASGTGKSRLVEWICQRAHELGVTTILQATHSDLRGRFDGLGPMVARHLHTLGLDRRETVARLQVLLGNQGIEDTREVDALTELVLPRSQTEQDEGARGVQFASPMERHVLVRRLLEREAAHRTVLLWLDDVQWGQDALDFAAHLLRARSSHPVRVLVLATLRSEALREGSGEETSLDALMQLEGAHRLHLRPLEAQDTLTLVEELLYLTGDLAHAVADRSGGNPMFAVQLVGDWVQTGRLRPGDRGFELVGEATTVPDDIHQIWEAPLRRLLDRRPESDRIALELAAVLGREVDFEEWAAVCGKAGNPPTKDLIDELVAQGLARGGRYRFSFVHGLLRESIERAARESDRWKAHNRLCAAIFAEEGASPEQLGRFLAEAGDVAAAVTPLLQGASRLMARGDYKRAITVLDRREQAIRRADLARSDEAWPEGRIVKIEALWKLGNMDEAGQLLDKLMEAYDRFSWSYDLKCRVLGLQARFLQSKGENRKALAVAREADKLTRRLGNPLGTAATRRILASILAELGELDTAEALARTARSDYEAFGDEVGQWECDLVLFTALKQVGRLREAASILERAMAFHEREGRRQDVAGCLNNLGEVERLRGNLGRAESCYRGARVIFESIGAAGRTIVDANLGLVLLERKRFGPAREALQLALKAFEAQGRKSFAGVLHAALIPCAAGERDWLAFDAHLDAAIVIQQECRFVDVDVAKAATLAGDLCVEARERLRAERAWSFARDQWRGADRTPEAQNVQRRLNRLRASRQKPTRGSTE